MIDNNKYCTRPGAFAIAWSRNKVLERGLEKFLGNESWSKVLEKGGDLNCASTVASASADRIMVMTVPQVLITLINTCALNGSTSGDHVLPTRQQQWMQTFKRLLRDVSGLAVDGHRVYKTQQQN